MVRWGSEFAVAKEIYEHFEGTALIVFSDEAFSENLRETMREMMDNAVVGDDGLTCLQRLRSELAIYVDVGEALYDFVYGFEGDGLLAPFIHTNMMRIMSLFDRVAFNRVECPKLAEVAASIAPNEPARTQKIVQMTCDKAVNMRNKFFGTFVELTGSCAYVMSAYQALSILQPSVILTLTVEQRLAYMTGICRLPCFGGLRPGANIMAQRIARLLAEVPTYLDLAPTYQGTNGEELLEWWRQNGPRLPQWRLVLQVAALFQPSSAAAERVFSMAAWMFGDDQDAALQDYKEASLMLRYNEIWRNK
jgi:hypothetical protein